MLQGSVLHVFERRLKFDAGPLEVQGWEFKIYV